MTVGTIISIGSLNADFQMRVPQPLLGTEIASEFIRVSGGKAANVAVIGRRLGADTRLFACVGRDDLAGQALEGPREAGVDLTTVRSAATHTGTAVILVASNGEKNIALAPGANYAWSCEAGAVAGSVSGAEPDSVVVVDLEISVEVAVAALEAAQKRGLEVVLDPAPAASVRPEFLDGLDHITPNPKEAEDLTGIRVDGPESALRAARTVCQRGVRYAYVKLPTGGCAVASSSGESSVVRGPDDLEVIDTTGAGDAFAGALAWARLNQATPMDAAEIAVAASACATTAYGSQASYPTLGALMAMRERTNPEEGPAVTLDESEGRRG